MPYLIIGGIALLIILLTPKALNMYFTRDNTLIGSSITKYTTVNLITDQTLALMNDLKNSLSFNIADRIASCYRPLEYNRYLASTGLSTDDTSSHIKGLAFDVVIKTAAEKTEFLSKLTALKSKYPVIRLLNETTHYHVDIDADKTPLWVV
jgi:hypothetical protein